MNVSTESWKPGNTLHKWNATVDIRNITTVDHILPIHLFSMENTLFCVTYYVHLVRLTKLYFAVWLITHIFEIELMVPDVIQINGNDVCFSTIIQYNFDPPVVSMTATWYNLDVTAVNYNDVTSAVKWHHLWDAWTWRVLSFYALCRVLSVSSSAL